MKSELVNILKEFAVQYKIDWRILFAILYKESNANGFEDGLIKKRYEKHIHQGFIKCYNNVSCPAHPRLPALKREWILTHSLKQLEFMSTSFGVAQIMGYWYKLLNYGSVNDMVISWIASEEIQIRDFCLFCVRYNSGKFLEALQKLDYQSIAKQYNGAGYKANNYDIDIEKYFNQAEKLKDKD